MAYIKTILEVNGRENLDKLISLVNDFSKSNNTELNSYIKKEVIRIYEQVMNRELIGTTNDNEISLYKSSYGTRDIENGFILYNNATIPQSDINSKNKQTYPKGFSIAMAFEYGVGVVGISTGDPNAWDYDIHNYGQKGWKYKDKTGNKISTTGYQGLEIFRKTQAKVTEELPKIIEEYFNKKIRE